MLNLYQCKSTSHLAHNRISRTKQLGKIICPSNKMEDIAHVNDFQQLASESRNAAAQKPQRCRTYPKILPFKKATAQSGELGY